MQSVILGVLLYHYGIERAAACLFGTKCVTLHLNRTKTIFTAMKRQFLYILLLMVGCIVQAQMPQLLPMPQKVSFTGKYVRAGVPVREVLVPEVPGAEFQDEAYHLTVGRDGVTIAAVT